MKRLLSILFIFAIGVSTSVSFATDVTTEAAKELVSFDTDVLVDSNFETITSESENFSIEVVFSETKILTKYETPSHLVLHNNIMGLGLFSDYNLSEEVTNKEIKHINLSQRRFLDYERIRVLNHKHNFLYTKNFLPIFLNEVLEPPLCEDLKNI